MEKDRLEIIMMQGIAIFILVIMILIFFMAIYSIVTLLINSNQIEDNPCLISIAEDYCESKGLEFSHNSIIGSVPQKSGFYCNKERELDQKVFLFKESEIERCLKND